MSSVTGLTKLLRTTAFRFSLLYFGLFAAAAAASVGYIYWKTNVLLAAQLATSIQAEIRGLEQQYRRGGPDQLRRAISERSETPGNSLYLLADAEGRHLSGNLKAVSEELWNAAGEVAFFYRRSLDDRIEERFAFAVIFRLANGYRLIVGRDIEDRREFGGVVRSALLWTLAGMAVAGLGGGLLIGRSFLRRIETMTQASRTIMAGDLSRRIPLTGSQDEFDRLAASLNAMLQRIEELIASFKEVSDNIAHDLKTPLNRLRNRVEAALRDHNGPQVYKDALQATIEDADELIKTFDALAEHCPPGGGGVIHAGGTLRPLGHGEGRLRSLRAARRGKRHRSQAERARRHYGVGQASAFGAGGRECSGQCGEIRRLAARRRRRGPR